MTFDVELSQLERELVLPYPDKTFFLQEIKGDWESAWKALVDEGMDPNQARAIVLKDFHMSREDLNSLMELHRSPLKRLLLSISTDASLYCEYFGGMVPLGLFCLFIERGVPVMRFIQEGGSPGMYAILFIGIYLLGSEFFRAMRLLAIKDHSKENLEVQTPTVLLGCSGLMLLAMGWTVMGIYNTAAALELRPTATDILFTGIKESLIPFASGLLLTALVLLAHYGTRHILHKWKAPLTP